MKIVLNGNIPEEKDIQDIITEVAAQYLDKLEKESPEDHAFLKENCVGVVFTEIAASVGFMMKDQDEPMVMTVDPQGDGIEEILVVTAEVDEDGNLIEDKISDNDEESLFTPEQAAIATGSILKSGADMPDIEPQYKQYTNIMIFEPSDEWIVDINRVDSDPRVISVLYYFRSGHDISLKHEIEINLEQADKTEDDVIKHYQDMFSSK